MSETALSAVYRALRQALSGAGVWGTRVHPDVIPAGVARPYATFFVAAGGERNLVKHADAEFEITVKCVADTMQQSLQGAAQISDALNDMGAQDRKATGDGIDGGDDWLIATITQGRVVHVVEAFEQAQPIYHDGHSFTIRMESKT